MNNYSYIAYNAQASPGILYFAKNGTFEFGDRTLFPNQVQQVGGSTSFDGSLEGIVQFKLKDTVNGVSDATITFTISGPNTINYSVSTGNIAVYISGEGYERCISFFYAP